MTDDDVVQMMRQAGLTRTKYAPSFRRLIEIATAAEREACAKVCEELVLNHPGRADLTAKQCAFAIRERGAP